jgi:hypothetical protein
MPERSAKRCIEPVIPAEPDENSLLGCNSRVKVSKLSGVKGMIDIINKYSVIHSRKNHPGDYQLDLMYILCLC